MITGAIYLKRGYTFDPEDSRMTNRLQCAKALLVAMGAETQVTHDHENVPSYFGHTPCTNKCKTSWPEWLTDEAFELAYKLASEVIRKRGEWHRSRMRMGS